jgi:hypothetical protein
LSTSRLERFAPLAGVVFFVLIVLTFVLSGDTPSTDDSTSDVVSFWSAHDSRMIAAAVIGTFAAIFLIWFGGSLRSALRQAEGGTGRLSTLAFAGILVIAISGAISGTVQFAAADSVGDVPASVTQTLSTLNEEFFLPFPVGTVILMAATGICALRFGALPRWLGWTSIVIAILSVAGPLGFVAFLALFVWVLVVSVLLYQRGPETPGTTATTATSAPPTA